MSQIHVSPRLVCCATCGLVQRRRELKEGEAATCTRCHQTLEQRNDANIVNAMILSLASLCLLIPSNIFPILNFNYSGQWKENWIISGFILLYIQGSPITAFMVFFTSVLAPIMLHVTVLLACGSILFKKLQGISRKIWGFLFEFKEWGMLDIFLVGLGVSCIKLLGMGDVSTRPGLYCIFGFVLVSAFATGLLEPKTVWNRLRSEGIEIAKRLKKSTTRTVSMTCHHCATVLDVPEGEENGKCPVCGTKLHTHHTYDFTQAWLYLHSATLLYLPANLLPVMNISIKSDIGDYTVMGGIEYLWHHGDYLPAVIVFIASIIVPVGKILLLYWLFFTHKSGRSTLFKTKVFLWVKALGRWSMVDIFVLSVLVALGQLGIVATVDPKIGAIPFCGMVVFTMLAANSFDPRSFWIHRPGETTSIKTVELKTT
ncbi:MAG: paraquat-inducible protein A [Verrucomicrobiota bacterium]